MNDDFAFTTRYDKTAYQALSQASWQMFRMPRLQSQAYPILAALSVLVAASMLVKRGSLEPAIIAGGVGLIVFMLAAIPISGVTARAKMCSHAMKDAQKKGPLPAQVHFSFGSDGIRATVNDQTNLMRYSQVSALAALGSWRFIFFGEAAYLYRCADLPDEAQAKRLDAWLEEKCGQPFRKLKGEGPKLP